MNYERLPTDIEELSLRMLDNFGLPESLWHPDYGWVLKNGEPTETTKAFFEMLRAHERKKNENF